jgi:hypothetical protein
MNENTNNESKPALTADITPAPYPISALSFRVAKTMPEIPHEYVVRTPENEEAYVALFNLIIAHGVHEMWRGRRYQYWYPGDGWKYWRMDNDIRYSRVLNRARAAEPYFPHMPWCPPLIDDVILPAKVNAEAEEIRRIREKQAKAAAESAE